MRKLQSLIYALAIIANAILVLSWTPILFAVFREQGYKPVTDAATGTALLCLIPAGAVLALVSLVWKLRP